MDRLTIQNENYPLKEKVVALVGAAALALGLGACGNNHESGAQESPDTTITNTDTGEVNPNNAPDGVYEPGPVNPDSIDIKNMISSVDDRGMEICFAGEGFRVEWRYLNKEIHAYKYGTSLGVSNCEGKGYPRLGHGWQQDSEYNDTTACLAVQHPDGVHHYRAIAFGGHGGEEKRVHVTHFGADEALITDMGCDPNPSPEEIISW